VGLQGAPGSGRCRGFPSRYPAYVEPLVRLRSPPDWGRQQDPRNLRTFKAQGGQAQPMPRPFLPCPDRFLPYPGGLSLAGRIILPFGHLTCRVILLSANMLVDGEVMGAGSAP
jgi:hypothetical protein